MAGLLIAAPSSGSGKTTVTLGLLRAMRDQGIALAPGKAGPDYIDPAFHRAASGVTCLNFDPWAMRPDFIKAQAAAHRHGGRQLIIEAMMGLYDGSADGSGSPADLAALLGLSVVLVVDCARQSQSVAALVQGFCQFRDDVDVAGVILNRVGSVRHDAMLRAALSRIDVRVLGSIRSDADLVLPSRHLGLIQAAEHDGLDMFIDHAASKVRAEVDLAALVGLADGGAFATSVDMPSRIAPLGSHIAVARDAAFAFSYPHLLEGWRGQGAQLSFFSPLGDEAPDGAADAVYLPGGYPELHAAQLSSAGMFRAGMGDAQARGAQIYGECGGYMVLGEGLVDADGVGHEMLGLLPLETSFAKRQRHLGYRRLTPLGGLLFSAKMAAHEFHYSTVVKEDVMLGAVERLFTAEDALGTDLGTFGLRRGSVCGSYMHLIDLAGRSV